MNQVSQKTEQQQRRKFKLTFRYRTLPCKVTLRGLIVSGHRHTPAELKGQLIQWDRITIPDYYACVKTSESGESFVLASGHRLRLKFGNNQALRVALRAKHRRLNRAWDNGEISVDRDFAISMHHRKQIFIKLLIFAFVWLSITAVFIVPQLQDAFSVTKQNRMPFLILLGIILFCSFAYLGAVVFLGLASSKFNVKNIRLSKEGLEVVKLDSTTLTKCWTNVSSIYCKGFTYKILCNDGNKFVVPKCRTIRPILELIQQKYFPICVEIETKASLRSNINLCIWVVVACMITAGLHSYLQSFGLVTPNASDFATTFLFIGLVLPASLIMIIWLAMHFEPQVRERNRLKKIAVKRLIGMPPHQVTSK